MALAGSVVPREPRVARTHRCCGAAGDRRAGGAIPPCRRRVGLAAGAVVGPARRARLRSRHIAELGRGAAGLDPSRRRLVGLALDAVVGIPRRARLRSRHITELGRGAGGADPSCRRLVGLALDAVVGIPRQARLRGRLIAVPGRSAGGADPSCRRRVGLAHRPRRRVARDARLRCRHVAMPGRGAGCFDPSLGGTVRGAAGAVGRVARRACLGCGLGEGAGAVLPPALLAGDRVVAAHLLAVGLGLGARRGDRGGLQRVARRARVPVRTRVVIGLLGLAAIVAKGLPVWARRRAQRDPARIRRPVLARRRHPRADAALPLIAAGAVIGLLFLAAIVAIGLPGRARRRADRDLARIRRTVLARSDHPHALAALPLIAASRVVVLLGLAAIVAVGLPLRTRRRAQRDLARIGRPVLPRRRRLGADAAHPLIAASREEVLLGLAAIVLVGLPFGARRSCERDLARIRIAGIEERRHQSARTAGPRVVLRLAERNLLVAADSRRRAVALPVGALRRGHRDPARIGITGIQERRLESALAARPLRVALVDDAGPALALVQYLAACAVRRYRLLAAMRSQPLRSLGDHHVAVLSTNTVRLDGLGDGRLAQIPVEHHARRAAQPRRPRRHSRARCARQTAHFDAEFLGAVAVAICSLESRHRTNARDHRGRSEGRDQQPTGPPQPSAAPRTRTFRAARRGISMTPPPPNGVGRAAGSCHERGKVTPGSIAVNNPAFRGSGIGCVRAAAFRDG